MSYSQLSTNPSHTHALEILSIEHSLPWIRFSSESHTTLSEFLTTHAPSRTMQSQVAWICVDSNRCLAAEGDAVPTNLSRLDHAWRAICASRTPVLADLDELARQHNLLGGKWLVFAPSAKIDGLWSKIARATHAGTLGISAKVSPRDGNKVHVICVFTRDYTDKNDVDRVREGLRRLGVTQKIGYKPDIYTHCMVYKDNPWYIQPTRYRD